MGAILQLYIKDIKFALASGRFMINYTIGDTAGAVDPSTWPIGDYCPVDLKRFISRIVIAPLLPKDTKALSEALLRSTGWARTKSLNALGAIAFGNRGRGLRYYDGA